MPKKLKSKNTVAVVISSEEAMIAMLNRYCELSLHLEAAKAAHEAMIAGLNTRHDEEQQSDRDELAMLESSIQLFAVNHRAALFPDAKKKSKEFTNAVLGFRDDPPAVAALIKGEKDGTIALRLSQLPWGDPYWDADPKLNKKQLLADRENLTPAQLAEAGITFKQEEKFFITPKAGSAPRVSKDTAEVAA
jgi:phage host-nuclease inhibitor protein Gam